MVSNCTISHVLYYRECRLYSDRKEIVLEDLVEIFALEISEHKKVCLMTFMSVFRYTALEWNLFDCFQLNLQ